MPRSEPRPLGRNFSMPPTSPTWPILVTVPPRQDEPGGRPEGRAVREGGVARALRTLRAATNPARQPAAWCRSRRRWVGMRFAAADDRPLGSGSVGVETHEPGGVDDRRDARLELGNEPDGAAYSAGAPPTAALWRGTSEQASLPLVTTPSDVGTTDLADQLARRSLTLLKTDAGELLDFDQGAPKHLDRSTAPLNHSSVLLVGRDVLDRTERHLSMNLRVLPLLKASPETLLKATVERRMQRAAKIITTESPGVGRRLEENVDQLGAPADWEVCNIRPEFNLRPPEDPPATANPRRSMSRACTLDTVALLPGSTSGRPRMRPSPPTSPSSTRPPARCPAHYRPGYQRNASRATDRRPALPLEAAGPARPGRVPVGSVTGGATVS